MPYKILKGIAALLLTVTVLVLIAPIVLKPLLNNWVKAQINSGINGKVDYSDLSVTWFRSFPNADISLHQLSIESNGEPLMKAGNLNFIVDIRSLFSGSHLKIISCSVNHPQFVLKTDSTGTGNWNIFKQSWSGPGGTGGEGGKGITLQIGDYKVSNATVQYSDSKNLFAANVQGLNVEGNINSSVLQSKIDIGEFNLSDSGKVYLNAQRAQSLMHYSLSGDSLLLDSLAGITGKNKLHVSGIFHHILGNNVSNPTDCNLQFQSTYFDADSWIQNFSKIFNRPSLDAPGAAVATKPVNRVTAQVKAERRVKILARIAFDSVLLNKILLQKVRAEIDLNKDSISITGLTCSLLGGQAKAQIHVIAQRDLKMNVDIAGCDIQQTRKAMPVANKFAPVAQYIDGSFSFAMTASGQFDRNMNLDYKTLTGDAKIQTGKTRIEQLPVLSDIDRLSKNTSLGNATVMNPTTCEMHCKNREIKVDPTEVTFSNGFVLKLSGVHSLDGNMNYNVHLDVPTAKLGGVAGMGRDLLSALPGLNIKMPEVLGFSFKVTGTVEKPNAILTGLGE